MRRLLNNVRWDPRDIRVDLRDHLIEQLGDPGGVLIVDETGFVKKGTRSAGVQPRNGRIGDLILSGGEHPPHRVE